MGIETYMWEMRLFQIAAIILFGGGGMFIFLCSPDERPDWDWTGDVIVGTQARIVGACMVVIMFVALFFTERALIKRINPDSWELSTSGQKIEILHNELQDIKHELTKEQ